MDRGGAELLAAQAGGKALKTGGLVMAGSGAATLLAGMQNFSRYEEPIARLYPGLSQSAKSGLVSDLVGYTWC